MRSLLSGFAVSLCKSSHWKQSVHKYPRHDSAKVPGLGALSQAVGPGHNDEA